MGLCAGRHEISDINIYIFPRNFFSTSEDMFDYEKMARRIKEVFAQNNIKKGGEVEIYVTGFTPALVEVLSFCTANQIGVMLRHYNRESGEYEYQKAATNYWWRELKEGGVYMKKLLPQDKKSQHYIKISVDATGRKIRKRTRSRRKKVGRE